MRVEITNGLGQGLDARLQLLDEYGLPPLTHEVNGGQLEATVPVGRYRAYMYVYDNGAPVLVGVYSLTLAEDQQSLLQETLLEGTSGNLSIRDFDFDGDLAIDRVELECGTDPEDATSTPGRPTLRYAPQQLSTEAGWYCGDMHVHSRHGRGAESVAELVRRAEKSGLDFIAVTDRGTMAGVVDTTFPTASVVVVPGMEWGNDDQGYALIYGPATHPDPPGSREEAQAECIRVQAQGGLFAIAHPCFPTAPWLWGLSYVNAIEVWCRDWRAVPPLQLSQLSEALKLRDEGKLVHSLAAAAARSELVGVSANEQAQYFWDCELNRGLMACAIGGSNSASPQTPLGRPLTWVYAREKSLAGILEGLRLGRTYVSCAPGGPELFFSIEVEGDTKRNVGIGGVAPINLDLQLVVGAKRAKGKKLQVLENGRPIRTVPIEGDSVVIRFTRHPESPSAFRIRVIGKPEGKHKGLGDLEIYALSSPIYAQDVTQEVVFSVPNLDTDKTWLRIRSENEGAEMTEMPPNAIELGPR